ncbi:MAG: amino acid carrier protein, partial [Oscillospiraceae bacterium]
MGFFDAFNEWILRLPTGIIYLVVLMGAGIFLTCRLKFVQFRHFFLAFSDTFKSLGKQKDEKSKGTISSFQATATALAGTLGTGNIIGVATAIVSGGPGAVFWMCISSFFGMATKFAEIVLAVHFRTQNKKGETIGGPMYYISQGLHRHGLAVLFSVSCVGASFGVGNLSQSNAISDALFSTFGIPKWIVGLSVMLIIGLIIIGGIKRIGNVTERLVPIMALTYFVGSLAAIVVNFKELPGALMQIVCDAFQPSAVSGGILGYLTSKSVEFGISRGVFSNEAG